MPYCSFAMRGLSEMKVKSFLLQVNGKGMMRSINIVISMTNRRNTCHDKCKLAVSFLPLDPQVKVGDSYIDGQTASSSK
jgi:hypothetical protein